MIKVRSQPQVRCYAQKLNKKVPGLLSGRPDKSFSANEIMRSAALGRGADGNIF
jgi:hypothetical protein